MNVLGLEYEKYSSSLIQDLLIKPLITKKYYFIVPQKDFFFQVSKLMYELFILFFRFFLINTKLKRSDCVNSLSTYSDYFKYNSYVILISIIKIIRVCHINHSIL